MSGSYILKLFSFKSPPLIGVDIQAHEVRLVQIRRVNHAFLVEYAAAAKLPEGIFIQGKVREWDALADILTELVRPLGLSGKAIAVSLPANLVVIQQMQLPQGMVDAAIEIEAYAQVERDFPGMHEDLCIDYHVWNQDKQAYINVLFVAARKKYIMEYAACFASIGFMLKIVDIDIYVIKRIFDFLLPQFNLPNEIYAILYENNNIASLIIFNCSQIIFYQQWEVSGVKDFLCQLKNKIQIFYATFNGMEVKKIAIYSTNKFHAVLINDSNLNSIFDIFIPDLFSGFLLHDRVKLEINSENSSHFLLACGLAMRELPIW